MTNPKHPKLPAFDRDREQLDPFVDAALAFLGWRLPRTEAEVEASEKWLLQQEEISVPPILNHPNLVFLRTTQDRGGMDRLVSDRAYELHLQQDPAQDATQAKAREDEERHDWDRPEQGRDGPSLS